MKRSISHVVGSLLASAGVIAIVPTGAAAAIVWMDDITVMPNEVFQMPVHIDTMDEPIVGFDLVVTIADPSVADFDQGVVDGGVTPPDLEGIAVGDFLDAPFRAEEEVGLGHARLAVLDNDFVDNGGMGVLAILTLQAGPNPGSTAIAFDTDRPGFETLTNTNAEDLTSLYEFQGATINVGSVVPEPTSLLLIAAPLVGLLALRRRRCPGA